MNEVRQPRTSLRLLFRFRGNEVELAERNEVEMIAPASVGPAPEAGKNAGAWLELQDRRGRTVFVRRLHDPFRTIADHHSPDGKIEAFTRPPETGEFEVIVPALAGATSAALFSSPLDEPRSNEPAAEVARFDLRQRRPRREEEP